MKFSLSCCPLGITVKPAEDATTCALEDAEDKNLPDASPAADMPPPPPIDTENQAGFADFGADFGDSAQPPPPPPPEEKTTESVDVFGQAPAPNASSTSPPAPEETPAPKASPAKAEQPILEPPPSSGKGRTSPIPAPIQPPPSPSRESSSPSPPETAPETAAPEAAEDAKLSETPQPPEAPKPAWEGGFENNFSDLGLAAEVPTTQANAEAAFTPQPSTATTTSCRPINIYQHVVMCMFRPLFHIFWLCEIIPILL